MESQEIAVVEQNTQVSALGNDNPSDVVARATQIANVLAPIIEQKELFKNISGKRHIMAEGWATLMGLLNVDPIVEYCRRIERADEIAYEAKVNLVRNGIVVSSAETIASDKEHTTWSRSEQGIKSMAQTRAFGKACRMKYSWIAVMAGYSATPAEEMPDEPRIKVPQPVAKPVTYAEQPIEFPGEAVGPAVENPPSESKPSTSKVISEKQQKFLFAKWRSAGFDADALKKYLQATYGIEHTKDLTRDQLNEVVAMIEKEGKK